MNISRGLISGNLTKDPDLRETPNGTPVCSMRVAVNTRKKDSYGEWVEKPNYFNVTVWGEQAKACAQYLKKGKPVFVDGRLEWREWTDSDGKTREVVEIVAQNVQFLDFKGSGGNRPPHPADAQDAPVQDAPVDDSTDDFHREPAPVGPDGQDDDIPF